MRIEWTTPRGATALHAVLTHRDGLRLVDPGHAAKAKDAADAVGDIGQQSLIAYAGAIATGAAPPADARLQAIVDAWPDAGAELAYRVRPLREQWEARGPGLMRQLERLTEPLGFDVATVALVTPLVGGHGVALPGHRAVLFEGVLANPHPWLPEVVRLAWLLAQLAADADPLALAPAVLAAAEEVELAAADEPTLAAALAAWGIQTGTHHAAQRWRWWEDYRTSTTGWRAAVAARP